MQLYNYFRSSASYRVRIALAHKGLPYHYRSVHLVRGEQQAPGFARHVGDTLVPALDIAQERAEVGAEGGTGSAAWLTQSMAIMEYLDELHPEPALLPGDALERARIRALSHMVACDIHPLNNLRVLKWLQTDMGCDEADKNRWYHHWVRQGLEAVERELARLALERQRLGLPASTYCWGPSLTMADCCLVPQIFNAQRFAVPLHGLPRTMAAFDVAMQLPAVQAAHPSACPDAA